MSREQILEVALEQIREICKPNMARTACIKQIDNLARFALKQKGRPR